jgi:hypothetical protein
LEECLKMLRRLSQVKLLTESSLNMAIWKRIRYFDDVTVVFINNVCFRHLWLKTYLIKSMYDEGI